MPLICRLAGSLRIYSVLTALALLGFPPIMLVISVWPRARAWGFIQGVFGLALRLAGIKVRIEGLSHLPRDRAALYMGNHVNWLDHLILATALPSPLAGFEKTENFKIPIYGPMMRRWGNVEVSRRKDPEEARRVAQEASRRLAEGCNFLVFPEGTRTRDGQLGAFKKGGFHMAIDAGAPIVPFAFQGAAAIMATGRWWTFPGTVVLHFGAPIDPADYGKDTLEALSQTTRQAIEALLATPSHATG
ncbi:MAG: lysophospholipid acyltransferase family protein [Candidatus Sericytochromatia bacterium]|nr:lysophospholipid acyltransferase family protein [Candidatus Sericytochromatia bacterium]